MSAFPFFHSSNSPIYTLCTYISNLFSHASISIITVAHGCARNVNDTINLITVVFIINRTYNFCLVHNKTHTQKKEHLSDNPEKTLAIPWQPHKTTMLSYIPRIFLNNHIETPCQPPKAPQRPHYSLATTHNTFSTFKTP